MAINRGAGWNGFVSIGSDLGKFLSDAWIYLLIDCGYA
jgi:hypothetical protein